jgi:hypothetical protein
MIPAKLLTSINLSQVWKIISITLTQLNRVLVTILTGREKTGQGTSEIEEPTHENPEETTRTMTILVNRHLLVN